MKGNKSNKNNNRLFAFSYYFVTILSISGAILVFVTAIQAQLASNLFGAFLGYITAFVLVLVASLFFRPGSEKFRALGKK